MKKEIAERWVKALRSGEYKQGKEQLKSKDGFCCLGVLCDIVKDDIDGHWKGEIFYVAEDFDSLNLPHAVKVLADMKSCTGNRRGKVSLIKLNDNERNQYNFNRIADIIEKEWKDL
jgi:hypothetical protein